jgi:hypothetical protein
MARKPNACKANGCPREAVSSNRYCGGHEHRYRRWGDPFAHLAFGDPALRRVTSIAPQQRSRSGIRGVRLLPSGRYWTRVTVRGTTYTAGVFDRIEDAAAAVAALRAELVNDGLKC